MFHKTKYFYSLLSAFCLLTIFTIYPTVRYVSQSGSSTPPYTSWETAADSIQKCINFADAGDTIYVASGVYKEKIVVENKFLTLIGSGWDSCIVDSRDLEVPTGFYAFNTTGDIIIKGFDVIVSYSNNGTGIAISDASYLSVIENNKIENCYKGSDIFNSDATLKNNIIKNVNIGIHLEAFNENYYPVIDSNIIITAYNISRGIEGSYGTAATIRNNLIILEDGGDGLHIILNPKDIRNNIVIKKKPYNSYGYAFSLGNGIIADNLVVGKSNGTGFNLFKGSNKVVNNNILNSASGYTADKVDTLKFHYNNEWDCGKKYTGFTADSTNIITDPMFVNKDSSDFHLQKYSPLINKGDPNILDKDGSRSDIGIYGGPLGESYTYLDLPPRPPVNLSATVDSGYVKIKWNRNTEADFNHYKLYRDTTADFTADSANLISTQTDTYFVQVIPNGIDNLYYKLTAVDNQNNVSGFSEELPVGLTSVKSRQPYVVTNYKLYQNYPNPFNPSTIISYRLKERGYVKLAVYDIKGALVKYLVNGEKSAGYYEAEFNPKGLASGIYLYRIEIINQNRIPVYTEMRKMVYVK